VRGLLLAIAVLISQQQAASRVLLATVASGGRMIVDLGIDDFVIEQGGSAGEVLDVHVADYPIAVLIDGGAASESEHATILDAAARFVTRVGERPIAAGTLSNQPALFATFDDERDVVLSGIRKVAQSPATGPLEAIAAAVAAIEKSESPFSAIVIVSSQRIDPASLKSTDDIPSIINSRIPVHVIARREAEVPGMAAAADALREVTELTHGQYTTIYSPASYAIALDRLADRMASELMVQFLVPPNVPATSDVKAGVRIPGARVIGLGVSR
jgi:hypothetical protein